MGVPGTGVGCDEGLGVGRGDGDRVGMRVGCGDGFGVGAGVGRRVGRLLGAGVGRGVGVDVGCSVGPEQTVLSQMMVSSVFISLSPGDVSKPTTWQGHVTAESNTRLSFGLFPPNVIVRVASVAVDRTVNST